MENQHVSTSARAPLFAQPGEVYRRPTRSARSDLPAQAGDKGLRVSAVGNVGTADDTSTHGGYRVWKDARDEDEDSDDERAVDFSLPATPLALEANEGGWPDLAELDRDPAARASTPTPPGPSTSYEGLDQAHRPTYTRTATSPAPDPTDEPQCRICLSPSDPSFPDRSDRLISPCLCTGSMRYVHLSCLSAWRGSGSNAKAFWECQACGHQYRLRRTLVSGLATSRVLLGLLSALLFLGLAVGAGEGVWWVLVRSGRARRAVAVDMGPGVGAGLLRQAAGRGGKRLADKRGAGIHVASMYDLWDDTALYDDADDRGSVVIIGGGAGLAYDLIIGALQTFADLATVLDYGSFGRWGWVSGLAVRFSLGIALLGSFSFLSLLLSLSLLAPLQLATGLRGGFFRHLRRTERAAGGLGAGQLMIVLFVAIGALNSLRATYGATRAVAGWGLRAVETQILEVNPEERRRAREARKKGREQGWARQWVARGGWKRWDGWREAGARGWVGVKGAWERGRGEVLRWAGVGEVPVPVAVGGGPVQGRGEAGEGVERGGRGRGQEAEGWAGLVGLFMGAGEGAGEEEGEDGEGGRREGPVWVRGDLTELEVPE